MTEPTSLTVSKKPIARRQMVKSTSIGLTLLKILEQLGGKASLTKIATVANESPAKVHRYLASIVAEGFVSQDIVTQEYYLSTQCITLGVTAMRLLDPIRFAEPSLIYIRDTLEVTCFVSVMGNLGPTIIKFEEPALPITVNVRIGSVLPLLWSATGRVFLAYLESTGLLSSTLQELQHASSEQKKLFQHPNDIQTLCEMIRNNGMAIVKDTNLNGISAIAVPLFNAYHQLCGVITALGPTGSFEISPTGQIASALQTEAKNISQQLGCNLA